ncbi:MAG TPA: PAS domain-containing protein, partial [Sphingomicrobium sp.]|nr:PAS domain-containing protein [Sphingomicrobium sp.]
MSRESGQSAREAPSPAIEAPARKSRPRDPADHQPLVTALGGGALTFEAMLAIADLLPVMIGYVDRDFIYRFVNRPIADWLEIPRSEILGHSMEDIIGEQSFAERRPLLEAALAGERKFFASEIPHRSRGLVAVQTDYVP